jgi:hypothetical protein
MRIVALYSLCSATGFGTRLVLAALEPLAAHKLVLSEPPSSSFVAEPASLRHRSMATALIYTHVASKEIALRVIIGLPFTFT